LEEVEDESVEIERHAAPVPIDGELDQARYLAMLIRTDPERASARPAMITANLRC
jgi:hypothetical protein